MKMMIATFFFLVLSWTSLAQNTPSMNSTLDSLFEAGVQGFLQKNHSEAQKNFLLALEKDPQNVPTIYNLSLVELELGAYGKALAYLRQLQVINPWYKDLDQSIDYIKKKMNFVELSNEKPYWESLRGLVLLKLPFWFVNLFAVALSFAFLVAVIILIKNHKKTQTWNWNFKISIFAVLYFLSLLLCALKWVDASELRATVLNSKVKLHIGADANLPVITELNLGSEVIVDEIQGDWIQVHLPGSTLGWVSKSELSIYGGFSRQ